MATRLEGFPEKAKHGNLRYPWDEWLDGGVWRLEKGTDFQCAVGSFANCARSAALGRGLRIKTHREGQAITIQAIPN